MSEGGVICVKVNIISQQLFESPGLYWHSAKSAEKAFFSPFCGFDSDITGLQHKWLSWINI